MAVVEHCLPYSYVRNVRTRFDTVHKICIKGKSKAIPTHIWRGTESPGRLKLTEILDNQHMKFCQPYAPAACTPKKTFLIFRFATS
jgi:hypothetical protein